MNEEAKNELFAVFSCYYIIQNGFGTLRSLINVGLRLLIWTLFIQGYFLIREATFIIFHCFFQGLYTYSAHQKIILNVKNHCFRTYFLVVLRFFYYLT